LQADSIHSIQDSVHPYFTLAWESSVNFLGQEKGIDINQNISQSFLPSAGTAVDNIHTISIQNDLITYLILGLFFGIALMWYFFPERLASVLNFPSASANRRLKDSSYNSPGFLISFLLFINYLITFSLFVYVSLKTALPYYFEFFSKNHLLFYIPSFIAALYVFRLVFIRITGFLFKTNLVSKQQQLMYVNVDNFLGIILIPLIFLILFSSAKYFIFAGIIVVLIVQIFRWLQTFVLGKFVGGFSVLHLFMYLCTLEIIPLFILIKLLKNSMV